MKSGTIKKTTSYIMGVPMNDTDINTPQMIYDRINNSEEFELLNVSFDDKNICPMVTVKYRDNEYLVDLKIEPLDLAPDFMISHPLKNECLKKLKKAKIGLTVSLTFNENIFESYHFQIKLIECIIPQKAAVIDFNTHRVLSPEWTSSAAASSVSPGPAYLFSVNVLPWKDNTCWIYSYGLNRCGIMELEVLKCNKEDTDYCASLLSLTATKAVCEGVFSNEYEPFEIASCKDGKKLLVTWKYWEEDMNSYPDETFGTGQTRVRDRCLYNGILYMYSDNAKEPCKVTDAEHVDLEKLIVEFPADETRRMEILAQETIPQFAKAVAIPQAKGMVKLRINSSSEDSKEINYEYIWAEVDQISENEVFCTAVNSSEFSDKVKAGEKVSAPVADITDWLVNASGNRIAPDCAFIVNN